MYYRVHGDAAVLLPQHRGQGHREAPLDQVEGCQVISQKPGSSDLFTSKSGAVGWVKNCPSQVNGNDMMGMDQDVPYIYEGQFCTQLTAPNIL